MSFVKVLYDEYTEVTRYADMEDPWDGDDTSTDYSIRGVAVGDKDSFYDFQTGYDVEDGVTYYLVTVVYSTACSFYREDYGRIEFIDLYRDRETAQKIADAIEKDSRTEKTELAITNSVGDEFKLYTGDWKGYFESFEFVEVYPVQIEKEYY
jgi:hypothetical protein